MCAFGISLVPRVMKTPSHDLNFVNIYNIAYKIYKIRLELSTYRWDLHYVIEEFKQLKLKYIKAQLQALLIFAQLC